MKIYFLTSNQNKIKEAQEIFGKDCLVEGKEVDLDEIQSDNAIVVINHKIEQARNIILDNLFLVEDTSLYLGEEKSVGPLVKFFPNDRIVKAFKGEVAEARCTIGLSDGQIFTGVIRGKIVDSVGDNGFGWDSIFQPEGYSKTFAEMTPVEKNSVSMRKIAFELLKEYLFYPKK